MKLGVIKNKNARIKKNKVRMKGDIEKKIKNDDKINLLIKGHVVKHVLHSFKRLKVHQGTK